MLAIRKMLVAGAMALTLSLPALALDINDVKVMVQNNVQEDVIINMMQNRSLSGSASAQDIVDLTNMGASPTLLSYLTNSGAPAVTYSAPSTTYVQPAPTCSPSYVVQQQPQVVVTSPPPVYYYSDPYRYYRPGPTFSFSFGGGRRHWGPGPGWGHRPGWGRPPHRGPRGRHRW